MSICKYYNGEPDNPFNGDSTERGLFWYIESIFVHHVEHNPGFLDPWIIDVERYIKEHPSIKNDITNPDKYSLQQKGLIFYIEAMIGKWMPGSEDTIFDY